jgi:hypothetical protein
MDKVKKKRESQNLGRYQALIIISSSTILSNTTGTGNYYLLDL